MRKSIFISITSAATATFMLLATTSPAVLADTASSVQDLTSLATISTTVTGQTDPIFSRLEQPLQNPLTSNTEWTGFCRQGGRAITLLFPKDVDVTRIQITTEQNPGIGVYFPKKVDFQAATNAQWYSLGSQQSIGAPNHLPAHLQSVSTQTFTFNSQGIEANAIRIEFPVSIWVFVRGLRVFGSTAETGQMLSNLNYPPVTVSAQKPGALTTASTNDYGIHNMLLVQTGSYGSLGTWTTDDFKPMLGYVNDAWYMVSPLFDSMLFLPYTNTDNTESYWTNYLNDLFSADTQLGALNQAVAATNQTLNRPGYKEKVVLTIPYFPFANDTFGQIDGQSLSFGGTPADPDAISAREAALNWYLSTLLSKWKAANYQNLQLVGLYWDEEQYKPDSNGDSTLLDEAIKLAHQNGLPLFWIPFYGASGSNDWSSLGFDAAWLQSNFIEQNTNANVTRITNAINEAKKNGLGIEVELTGLDSSTGKLYQNFLQTLDSYNFGGNGISHTYYDGSKLLLKSEQSIDPYMRQFYDETAMFILTGNNG